jgi:dihydrofolate synthase/folylpolyglutamate synthase
MADKDVRGLLQTFEPALTHVVVTQVSSTSRGLPAEELGEIAAEIFGAERVTVAPRLDDAIEAAVGMAEGEGVGTPGVLVSGSVVLVGEARSLLVSGERASAAPAAADQEEDADADWDPLERDLGGEEPTDEERESWT